MLMMAVAVVVTKKTGRMQTVMDTDAEMDTHLLVMVPIGGAPRVVGDDAVDRDRIPPKEMQM